MKWYWRLNRQVRTALHLRKQVWYLYNSQRDLLNQEARQALWLALEQFNAKKREANTPTEIVESANELERIADANLIPYPYPTIRENLKEFLVSAVFILSLFTFFVQPMKIPSGSAQPTLWGDVITVHTSDPAWKPPPLPRRVLGRLAGVSYHVWIAQDGGILQVDPPRRWLLFIRTQTLRIGRDSYTFWWPPEGLVRKLQVTPGRYYYKGETVFKISYRRGDRLFVDKFTYHFRRPKRGEIIVFSSHDIDRYLRVYRGLPVLVPDTHYIKRLIAFGGERVQIGDDRHVRINGVRLERDTPHFERVYSFDESAPPAENVYSGHVNEKIARAYGKPGLAPLFPDENAVFEVRKNYYLAFGDNTMNSYDGRAWGDFPREKVVGRALFVFWPLSKSWGPIELW